MARAFVAAPILVMLSVIGASAQSHVDDLRSKPRVAVRDRADRERRRADAALQDVDQVRRAVGLDDCDRRRAGDGPGAAASVSATMPISCCRCRISTLRRAGRSAAGKTPPPKPAEPTAPTRSDSTVRTEPQVPRTPRARRREDIVRIGGSVTVDSDEYVRGDVVVIGGSANINGEVDGEVVVVGGSARFGPQADVRGDITVVGGGLSRDPGAVIRGAINEVGFGDIPWRGEWGRRRELGLDERNLSRRAADRHARAHHAAHSSDDSGAVRREDAGRTDRRPRRGRSGEVVVRRFPRGDALHPRSHHDGGRARHLDHRHPVARACCRWRLWRCSW